MSLHRPERNVLLAIAVCAFVACRHQLADAGRSTVGSIELSETSQSDRLGPRIALLDFAPAASDTRLQPATDGFVLQAAPTTGGLDSLGHTEIAVGLRERIPNLTLVATSAGKDGARVQDAIEWAIGHAPDVLFVPNAAMAPDDWLSPETVDLLVSAWEKGCLPFTIVRAPDAPRPSGVLVVSASEDDEVSALRHADLAWRVDGGSVDDAAIAASVAELLISLPVERGAVAHLRRVALLGIPYPPQERSNGPSRLRGEWSGGSEVSANLVGSDGQLRPVGSWPRCDRETEMFVLDDWFPCDVTAEDPKIYFDRTRSEQELGEAERRLIARAADNAGLIDVLAAGHLARVQPIFHFAGLTTFRATTEPHGRRAEVAERLLGVHTGGGQEALFVVVAPDATVREIR